MAELAALLNKRANIKGRQTRIVNAVREFKDGDNAHQLKTRITHLDALLNEFIETQLKIESLDATASQKDDQEVFEKIYFDAISEIQLKLDRHLSSANNKTDESGSNISNSNTYARINLPPVPLKPFTGLRTEWNSFFDTYSSIIHNNKDLNDCQKFIYLKSCLRDEALHAVDSLPVSEANYATAWDILRKRYENKRLIVQEHVSTIINLPVLKKPSHTEFRQFIDKIISNIEALRVLQIPVDTWDALIVPIISKKLDYVTLKDWQAKLDSEIPKLSELIKLLEKRLEILYATEIPETQKMYYKGNAETSKFNNNYQGHRRVSNIATIKSLCNHCKGTSHSIYNCRDFLNLSIAERLAQVNANKLCKNCLRSNHTTVECRSNRVCGKCKERHNILIHEVLQISATPLANSSDLASAVVANHSMHKINSAMVLLSTAVIYAKDVKGGFQECRALLDVGSQSSFISSSMFKRLGLKSKPVNIPVIGIGQTATTITQSVNVIIKSRIRHFTAELTCLVTPKITENLPLQTFNTGYVEIPANITLADPKFNESKEIDLLIGAELFWKLLCVGQIQINRTQPFFQKTHLGWIIGGAINLNFEQQATSCNLALRPLEEAVNKFWQIEHCLEPKNSLSKEEIKCETHFRETHERIDNGQFQVKLPVMDGGVVNLGSSFDGALKRFYCLERKLGKDCLLRRQYCEFMQEYLELNHMELVPNNEIHLNSYYLPHHGVFKESSSTTKLRVVFDASFKTPNGLSLNDNLMCGPVIQQDLFSILTRFRTFQYVLSGDITKMYRQIKIHKSQIDYQRILWRNDPEENIQIFRLSTLTYGTKPASFIATRCLRELALQNQTEFPRGSEIISRDFYMDDLLTGADSAQELFNIKQEVTAILASGGFELRKFASNNNKILQDVNASHQLINLDKDIDTKTLGLLWNPIHDQLKYDVNINFIHKKITKRSILSIVAQIFDPLGLLGPVTMRAKIILQQLWSLKLDWDESVPLTVHTAWTEFLGQLRFLNDLKIERKVITVFPTISIEIHGFSDASQLGFGAALYVKATDCYGNHSSNLLCAKSRVAPLKTISIPRLELCSALLLAQLFSTATQTLGLNIKKHFLWTDSTIVLAWLDSCPSTLNTFVANRVSEIQNLTDINNWYHVNSESNPADIISRGKLPQDLLVSKLWFHGPKWLRESESYELNKPKVNNEDVIEKRKVALLTLKLPTEELPVMTKFSKFYKLQRIVAFCLRFIQNCKDKSNKLLGNVSVNELITARNALIHIIQQQEFAVEINLLKAGKLTNKQSKLLSLNPFLDEFGLLRVGGRLKNASVSTDKKYPIILPKRHYITKLIIIQEHERQLHAGAQATLASLRQVYWIIDARNVIRFILNKCVKCFRARPKIIEQKMGDLPKERIELTRPFLKTGVDYAGPILIKEGRGKGKRSLKAYIALFICFSTKAVHLELVGDLSTDTFLNALKRFIARRGCVSTIFSDNATNFVGAKRELEQLNLLFKNQQFQKTLNDTLQPLNITWKFIPPRSPTMGGLWETNVKSVKYHLKRTVGNALLTYEEMYTLLTRIEACLNSRPLIPLTSDPNDLVALTPGHFLIGEPLTTLADPDITEVKVNRLSRWQYVEQVRQHFWKRWYREYLVQIQQRTKWQHDSGQQLRLGSMVVLVDEGAPPQQWLLGRITEVHPGADGIVRVVTVKTVRGLFKRSVRRICVLPISAN